MILLLKHLLLLPKTIISLLRYLYGQMSKRWNFIAAWITCVMFTSAENMMASLISFKSDFWKLSQTDLSNYIDHSSQADDLWDDAQAAVRVSTGHFSAYRALLIGCGVCCQEPWEWGEHGMELASGSVSVFEGPEMMVNPFPHGNLQHPPTSTNIHASIHRSIHRMCDHAHREH